MIDDTPGQEPPTGQETSLGGASDWSTVPAASAEPGAPAQTPAQSSGSGAWDSGPTAPPPVHNYPLEPLPPPSGVPPASGYDTPAPVTSAGPGASTPAGYAPVYGTSGTWGTSWQQPPPPSGGQYPPPPPPYGYGAPGQPGYPPPAATPPGQGISSTAAAAIAYITFIPAVIFLVVEPYNRDRFVRFHAWQCIALTVVWVGIGIIFRVLGFVGLHLLWWVIHSFIMLALFVFWLIALVKASQGQWYRIPLVGDLAQSFSGKEQ